MIKFAHLHCHSHYSLLDGASDLEKLVAQSKTLGMTALALTDHGNLHGSLKFYKECKKQGINPIVGMEAYVTSGSRRDRIPGSENYHLTLLAKNRKGWQNLIKLSSTAYLEGFYYKPRIDRDLLAQLGEGLIVLSGCISSELSAAALACENPVTDSIAEWYHQVFGDDFYLETMVNGTHFQDLATKGIREVGKRKGLPCVATADCHYVLDTDSDLQDTMVCISTGRPRSAPIESPRMSEKCYYLRSPEEMLQDFPREDVERTQEIANQVDIEIETGVRHFPIFKVPNIPGHKSNPRAFLRQLCYEGLVERVQDHGVCYTERLDYELDTIHALGFDEYFLIVADFCQWATSRGILVSARGSGVGALSCYCLWISNVDPIERGLLFERFLDPSRKEAPDIDIDIDKERRGEVMQYVKDKYGEDCVAQIATFGTLAAKSAVKEVAKTQLLSQAKTQSILDHISDLPNTTLDGSLESSEGLREILEKDHQCQQVYSMAQRIEGMARSVGTHAAGVVISDRPLTNYLPLMRGKDGGVVSQFDMDDCESVGLLKIDFLGLRNLTLIHRTIKIINESTGYRIDPVKIRPQPDKEVWDMLGAGSTQGVFQLESTGMTGLLIRLRPDNIEHICACVALYRPGPLDSGFVDLYVDRKNGSQKIPKVHPAADEILSTTYGVPVYQEQIMLLAHRVAGIPLSDAYSLIKAVSKKIKEKVVAYRERFINGCISNKVHQSDADKMWSMIEASSRYAFNRSHAMAYAYIAYQTAYLKAHYPVHFMAALLSCDIDQRNFTQRDPLVQHLEECRRCGIVVSRPDVNTCGPEFKVKGNTILFGLDAIKGVPHRAAVAIERSQPFSGLFDFCRKVPKSDCPRAAIRSLIHVGAIAEHDRGRGVLCATIDRAMKLAEGKYKNPAKQEGKFSDSEPIPKNTLLQLEHDLTGVYFSGHPLDDYPDLCLLGSVESLSHYQVAVVAGVATSFEVRHTQSGKMFVTFCVESPAHSTDCLVWEPKPGIEDALKNQIVVVRGRANARGANNTLTVMDVKSPEQYLEKYRPCIFVVTPPDFARLWKINSITSRYPGPHQILVSCGKNVMRGPSRVRGCPELFNEIQDLGMQVLITEEPIPNVTAADRPRSSILRTQPPVQVPWGPVYERDQGS